MRSEHSSAVFITLHNLNKHYAEGCLLYTSRHLVHRDRALATLEERRRIAQCGHHGIAAADLQHRVRSRLRQRHRLPARLRGGEGLSLIHILHHLSRPDAVPLLPSRHISRIQKAFHMPTSVSFREDATNGRTMVELVSWDRPGLLCRVGQAFIQCGVQLHNAKIATIGARAEDVFFVTDRDNRILNDLDQYTALREALVKQLDSENQ